jgi:hypothetical protein
MAGCNHDPLLDEQSLRRQLQRKSHRRRKDILQAREGICGAACEPERSAAPPSPCVFLAGLHRAERAIAGRLMRLRLGGRRTKCDAPMRTSPIKPGVG